MENTNCVADPIMCCYVIVGSITFIPHGHFISFSCLFHVLFSFGGINMRLALSLKQGHFWQWREIYYKEGLGTSVNTWASTLGGVVLFSTARWWFLSRDLSQLCGNPWTYISWHFLLNQFGWGPALLSNSLTLRNFLALTTQKKIVFLPGQLRIGYYLEVRIPKN